MSHCFVDNIFYILSVSLLQLKRDSQTLRARYQRQQVTNTITESLQETVVVNATPNHGLVNANIAAMLEKQLPSARGLSFSPI